jgi:ArsR family transcriptional regulator, cadmium/lead-responsive transcriptional repressor
MPAAVEDRLWSAVAEPSRLRLLEILLARGDATATMLAEELPFSRQAVSKHLAVLDRVGLVASRRQRRETRYTVDPERLAAAARALNEVAAQWDRRLAAIKRIAEALHAERQRR